MCKPNVRIFVDYPRVKQVTIVVVFRSHKNIPIACPCIQFVCVFLKYLPNVRYEVDSRPFLCFVHMQVFLFFCVYVHLKWIIYGFCSICLQTHVTNMRLLHIRLVCDVWLYALVQILIIFNPSLSLRCTVENVINVSHCVSIPESK